ncbi:MAG: T9SS type A sorting domain-containing protein [Bacteroidetes bacterium]|nr:T9SS type A sorting domain-containing protein [Bacteroidota bacterium]
MNTVAIYDGFSFPIPAAATTFMDEYLAANGKIYLTSGNGVQHLHEINYPDSAGLACDVQQDAVSLGVWHFRAVPNHPNYNLGPVVGSVCDSITSIAEIKHDFLFSISPNPTSDEYIKLVYLLPQNKAGVFEVYNMTGQLVYKMNLPPWSTLQFVKLPELSNGVYTCVIRSGYERVGKKLVFMK